MNEDNLQQQISRLNKGVSKTITKISQDSVKFLEYEKSVAKSFNTTESRIHYIEKYANNLKNQIISHENEQNNIMLTILYRQFQNLKHNVKIIRAIKRQGILNSCRQHQIPIAILNPSTILHDLTNLQIELDKFQQELAINTSEISKYYQLPLCDCAFSDNQIHTPQNSNYPKISFMGTI
ncbi:hypothetical protein NQ314_008939 [Rhamnusium bicolor]|uniref:Uncharacterized protein n=1 Tax=Rhamnusium bicolor TaxID=1586634 RepID=A0AAV8Y582_9CUCU|nr:hypothetical protein NQ314_008939 [Rhamnusium bicolor]